MSWQIVLVHRLSLDDKAMMQMINSISSREVLEIRTSELGPVIRLYLLRYAMRGKQVSQGSNSVSSGGVCQLYYFCPFWLRIYNYKKGLIKEWACKIDMMVLTRTIRPCPWMLRRFSWWLQPSKHSKTSPNPPSPYPVPSTSHDCEPVPSCMTPPCASFAVKLAPPYASSEESQHILPTTNSPAPQQSLSSKIEALETCTGQPLRNRNISSQQQAAFLHGNLSNL